MKERIKRVFKKIINTDIGWRILKPSAGLGNFLYLTRQNYLKEIKETEKSSEVRISANQFGLITHGGPFEGLVYPSMKSVGSSFYPKIIGSYEKELWPILNEMKANDYSDIIDIGCAEGYYAVGFARMFENAIIHAYDTNFEARKLCREMSVINNVEERIKIHTNCSSEILEDFNFSRKGLIICDCEGCEKNIFTHKNLENMKNCDLIIETHDFLDINISVKIKELFKNTHDLISIKSIDDIEKAHTYKFKVLDKCTLEDKLLYLSEYRPKIMEWVICKPKKEIVE